MKNNLNLIVIILLFVTLGCFSNSPQANRVNQSSSVVPENGSTPAPTVSTPAPTAAPVSNAATSSPTVAPANTTTPKPRSLTELPKTTSEKTVSDAPSQSTETKADKPGATARCKDGSLSYSKTRRGACSRHGGVAEWF